MIPGITSSDKRSKMAVVMLYQILVGLDVKVLMK